MEYTLTIVVILLIIYALILISKVESRLNRLAYSIEQISEKLEIDNTTLNDELRQLVQQGDDFEAVKLVRETLGLSLAEGKEYVNQLKKADGMTTA